MKDSDWEILYELHKNPNMTKVAEQLYLTQPSLTKRLHNMEDEFQTAILNRTSQGLRFTPEGEYLAERAVRYRDFIHETRRGLKSFREKGEGVITIGSSYTYSKYTLTDVLVTYRKEHPGVEFEIVNDQSNLLFRKVVEGSVDVGFIRGDYEGPVRQTLLGSNQAFLVTREAVDMRKLPEMVRINYKTNDRTIKLLDDWWQDRFDAPVPTGMHVGYIDFAWQIIEKGVGYTCCFLPDQFKNEFHLCLTPLTKKDGSRVIRNTWFVYPKTRRLPGILEDFIGFIRTEYERTGEP